jgi:uncharacterized protein YdhG (YjbR/CyaY superfamily)
VTAGSQDVDAYIGSLPEERRAPMNELRQLLRAGAPRAEEVIAYKMPALRLAGRFFMSYDAYKSHYSLFPATDRMIDELGDELAPYVYGKGTLRFKAGEPLPAELIRRVVEIRLKELPATR